MFQKKTYKKRLPSRAVRGKFSQKIINDILERDNEMCVLCGRPVDDIHHVKFKSNGGRGVFTNGVCLCRNCHNDAHRKKDVRIQLENMMIDKYGIDYYKDNYDIENN